MGIKTQYRAQGEQRFSWWLPEVILCCAFWGHLLQLLLPGPLSTLALQQKANEAGLQLRMQGKEKTSRVIRKIKSRSGVF